MFTKSSLVNHIRQDYCTICIKLIQAIFQYITVQFCEISLFSLINLISYYGKDTVTLTEILNHIKEVA